jgi:hypothetical protein
LDHEHGAIVFFARAIQLVANVNANCAPPDFAGMIERPLTKRMQRSLVSAPAVEVLLHTRVVGIITRRDC